MAAISLKLARRGRATLRVLDFFAECPKTFFNVQEVMEGTKLPSGTIYPLTAKLAAEGWLNAKWERVAPVQGAKPPRRLYGITKRGATAVRDLKNEKDSPGESLAKFGPTSVFT